jgi:hypothetical protein
VVRVAAEVVRVAAAEEEGRGLLEEFFAGGKRMPDVRKRVLIFLPRVARTIPSNGSSFLHSMKVVVNFHFPTEVLVLLAKISILVFFDHS